MTRPERSSEHPLPEARDLPLMVDLYELAMTQAYWVEGMHEPASFSLFFRELPPARNFMLACGQNRLAALVPELRFRDEHLERLARLEQFRPDFLDWLADWRFTGRIRALPEGTPVFPQEPILEVDAPLPQAQLLETLAMNYVHLETVLASKAVRLVQAAGGAPVIDFGMRRMQGLDAAYRGVRAFRLAGLAGTSHVLAGQDFDLPVRGTMAHSYIQAHDDELAAFRAYARLYPGTTLLVDTYDTEHAVTQLIDWLKASPEARIGAIRLDSGDLEALSHWCRHQLDRAGFGDIKILASGGLDEYRIAHLRAAGAPIDGYGVGSAIGTGGEAPTLDLAYKLTDYAGRPRMKSSSGKHSWPGRKQVYRLRGEDGYYCGDRITEHGEDSEGEPLLRPVVDEGQRLAGTPASMATLTEQCGQFVQALPDNIRGLEPAEYPVTVSERLDTLRARTLESL